MHISEYGRRKVFGRFPKAPKEHNSSRRIPYYLIAFPGFSIFSHDTRKHFRRLSNARPTAEIFNYFPYILFYMMIPFIGPKEFPFLIKYKRNDKDVSCYVSLLKSPLHLVRKRQLWSPWWIILEQRKQLNGTGYRREICSQAHSLVGMRKGNLAVQQWTFIIARIRYDGASLVQLWFSEENKLRHVKNKYLKESSIGDGYWYEDMTTNDALLLIKDYRWRK